MRRNFVCIIFLICVALAYGNNDTTIVKTKLSTSSSFVQYELNSTSQTESIAMTSETTPVSTTARQTTVESVHSSTKPLISKLLWTSKAFVASPLPLVAWSAGILSMADIGDGPRLLQVRKAIIGEHLSEFWALAADYHRNLVYYTDFKLNYFGTFNMKTGKHKTVFQGLSFGLDGIAVDWLSGNVYWTDTELNQIMVADPSLKYFTNLFAISSQVPAKIAINPLKHTLYWSENGVPSAIFRGDTSGREKSLLYEVQEQYFVDELTFDVNENRLYWSESTKENYLLTSIRAINMNQPRKRYDTFYTANYTRITGLASKGDYLYFIMSSRIRYNGIFSVHKETKSVQRLLSVNGMPRSLTIFSPEIQPFSDGLREAHPCSEHDCEEICLTAGLTTHKCACQIGKHLSQDGRTCTHPILTGNFALLSDSRHSKIYQLSFDEPGNFTALSLHNVSKPESIEYDYKTGMIYWSDPVDNVIMRSFLNGSNTEIFINDIKAYSIAIDPKSRNLYIANFQTAAIVVASLDLPNVTATLHVENVHRVWKMRISDKLGKLYWTDWGQVSTSGASLGKVESINLDGSGRAVLLDRLDTPFGLAIDEEAEILYWHSLDSSSIFWYKLETNEYGSFKFVKSSAIETPVQLAEIDYYNGFIYVTDLTLSYVFRVSTNHILSLKNSTGSDVQPFGPSLFYTLTGIKVVTSTPPALSGTSKCAKNRNGCPEICLSSSNDVPTCVCHDFSVYAKENNSCVVVINRNDTTPPSFTSSCLNTQLLHVGECSTTYLFNFTPPVATDNSGKVIVKALVNEKPPYNLTVGAYSFRYQAYDYSGNRAYCSIIAFVFGNPQCRQPIPVPKGFRQGKRTCQSLFGSTVDMFCIGENVPAFQYRCNEYGTWEPDIQVPTCSKPAPRPTKSPTIQQTGNQAWIAAVVIVLIIVFIVVAFILIRKYRRHWVPVFISWKRTSNEVLLDADYSTHKTNPPSFS